MGSIPGQETKTSHAECSEQKLIIKSFFWLLNVPSQGMSLYSLFHHFTNSISSFIILKAPQPIFLGIYKIIKWKLPKVTQGFPGDSVVKNLPTKQEAPVLFLNQEDPLKKETKTPSSVLAWEISWTEEPGGLPSMGLLRVRHN